MSFQFHHGFALSLGILAARRRLHPLVGGAIAGGVRAAEFSAASPRPWIIAAVFAAFGGLVALMAWLFCRLDRRDAAEPRRPLYLEARRGPFRWEYIPLGAGMLALFAGEGALSFLEMPSAP